MLPDLVLWTHLPAGLEQAYWKTPATKRNVLTTDKAGLLASLTCAVVLHGFITYMEARTQRSSAHKQLCPRCSSYSSHPSDALDVKVAK
jgi:hypothetical protein